jgi:uncharacterized DUF497 family protein
MRVTYDNAKNERNVRERGISFDEVYAFDFTTALVTIDTRKDYGEIRMRALGYVGNRLHALCYKDVEGGIRVISFRKANRREQKQYEKTKARLRK